MASELRRENVCNGLTQAIELIREGISTTNRVTRRKQQQAESAAERPSLECGPCFYFGNALIAQSIKF